ncbi:ABC-type Zn2+ transport system, periplasmic component/surface adhesin (plasmid) [Phaeobacter piscinae]|uniref:High-affinity zinc uptake system protein ZnuA n=1 Tax=Phaeobacter piscinae TaxID=1580596 RepID=A0ABN5DMB8_9RHOB|nr:zinc ABC transporter substrate-binding protein [Phaeobacter piscinae]ATG37739.1 ABC-type Zn2+ transport system, periplasmic component/surface adhesin [Phaeobacter piscinae]AUQ88260.1 ABC-type Zn2+ transport system, periplasmic component/surface adhesin [Phaeobacter piscinae]AUR26143.1 ABC-type Zn2+ transport system, periplasmic component/surface adhesin [Phaeobacter piscinae]
MGQIRFLATAATVWTAATAAFAEVPAVAADITPVHGLVSRVMQGVGTPDLVVPPGASPHSHSMRPSEARALDQADFVFWVGPMLTPWLEGPIATLASDATVIALLDAEATQQLMVRESVQFGQGHDDDHADDHHDGHDEEHHDAHHDDDHDGDHAGEHDKDHDAETAHADEHGHSHEAGSLDPHAWLMAENGSAWLQVIAEALAAADPENAALYMRNAAEGQAEIATAAAEIATKLDVVASKPFVVFHDAYQYFETGFGIEAAAAISLSDASDPSPARIAEVRAIVQEMKVRCVLSEPQFNSGLVATVLDGTDAGTAVVDPLGVKLEPGPQFYPQLLTSVGEAIAGCY